MARPAPQPRRNPLLPFYAILGVVALAGAFLLFRQMSGGGGAAATELQPVVMTPEQLQRVPGIMQGQPSAPVVVMEFADFQCPSCMQFATFSKPLMKDYVDNGTVRFVWYDYPLPEMHQNAILAARAGRCANEQNQFWTYHDMLFSRQSEWSEAGDAANRFIGYAQQAGLDRGAFAQCLRSDKYQREVSESRQLGSTFGVSGTPTIFVNGKKLDGYPTSRAEWERAIREAQGSAAPAAAPADTPAAPAAADSTPADSAP
ncbi:MAG TPA: DsbA family protein, partial [Longimicrobiaceae bacterium]|nr:DsbA family protein [Longimicrobiaceae bacterium]